MPGWQGAVPGQTVGLQNASLSTSLVLEPEWTTLTRTKGTTEGAGVQDEFSLCVIQLREQVLGHSGKMSQRWGSWWGELALLFCCELTRKVCLSLAVLYWRAVVISPWLSESGLVEEGRWKTGTSGATREQQSLQGRGRFWLLIAVPSADVPKARRSLHNYLCVLHACPAHLLHWPLRPILDISWLLF